MIERAPLSDLVSRILTENCSIDVVRAAEQDRWAPGLWKVLAAAGVPWVSVAEEAGGSGGTFADALTILLVAGQHAAPVPLAETGPLAGWLLAGAGLEVPTAPLTVAAHPTDNVTLGRRGTEWILDGEIHRVPWARAAERIVLLARVDGAEHVVTVPSDRGEIRDRANLAGEPRESVRFDSVVVERENVGLAAAGVDQGVLRLRGALARAALMAGALERLTVETIEYSGVRHQFNRPISQFQAVRMHLVKIAQRTAWARLAVDVAIEAAEASEVLPLFEIASAKTLAGEAAGITAASAHQVHGAIGMTREYHLHTITRRLWAWRDEFGSERHWSTVLGTEIANRGAHELWPRLTQDLDES